MIGVHGLQDNAATFDRLAPLLPANFYLVSIDLPGHGLSSHLPKGILYNFLDMMQVISRVADHFGWPKFYFLAHSLGGQLGTYYASIYPERIIKLVALDALRPGTLLTSNFIPIFRSRHKKLLQMEKKLSEGKEPCYTYGEAKQRLFASRYSELTSDSADILLKRSLRPNNGGYTFRLDQRLKFLVYPYHTHEQQIAIMKNLRCNFLLIKARESLPLYELRANQDLVNLFRSNSAIFEEIVVEGNHDVHLNYPERVASHISSFLLHTESKL
jgi:pimeloyl-ACP methyl ester carboxylesterase